MPILEIQFVGDDRDSNIAQKLADAVGLVLHSSAGQTWVKVSWLASSQYAENLNESRDLKPVFVSLLLRKLPDNEQKSQIAKDLCKTIAQVSGRQEENIHILFLPEGAGRMAFGGDLHC